MHRILNSALLGTLLFSQASLASQEDFKQQIEMSYQYQSLDVKNKTSIITGNVHIRQGSLNIYADRVEIDATGGEGKEVFIATGNRASYEQQLEDGSSIKAFANTIEYSRDNRILSLNGNAEVTQASSQFMGDVIVFNMELEQLTAEGNEAPVTTIFQPQSLRKLVEDQQQDEPEATTEKDGEPQAGEEDDQP